MVNSGLCLSSTPSLRKLRPISYTRSMPPTMQPLEVELGGDAQVEVAVQRVVMGDERARRGAAGERLQDGRLDLDEAALVQEAAHGGDDPGALDEDFARARR